MLLAIETATDVCAVALLAAPTSRPDGARVVASRRTDTPRAHAARLAPMIAEVLSEAGLAARELRTVAVSVGPGSFTGLRIGIGTATGLALATGAALVAVPTLDALVAAARDAGVPGDLLAVLPSRRGEVYVGGDGEPPRAVATDALPTLLARAPVTVVGPAVASLSDEPLGAITAHQVLPTAEAVARWAEAHGAPVAPEAVAPLYVQPFVPTRRAAP